MQTVTTRDNRRLAYNRRGAGPLVVAHPGGPGLDGAVLGDLGGLDRHAELLLIDPRATGGSDTPAGGSDGGAYELADYARDVVDLVESLDRRPHALLGHSHGGIIALLVAAGRPDLVDRLVVVDTPTHVDSDMINQLGGSGHVVELGGQGSTSEVRRPLFRFGGGDGARGPSADDDAHDDDRPDDAEADDAESDEADGRGRTTSYGLPTNVYEPGLAEADIVAEPLVAFNDRVLRTFDLRPVLAAVTCPTLVVCGRDDVVAGPGPSGDLASGLPDGRLAVIEGSGHVPFVENAEAFREAVVAFLGLD